MFSLKFFVASIVLAGFFLSVQSDELILIRPPKDEDCHRFDEMYLQGTKLMNDFSASNCHPDSALNYFKRLHALRNKVKELGCRQSAVNLYAFNDEVLKFFRGNC